MNQGLDLDLRLKNLVITGACLSSREDRLVYNRCFVYNGSSVADKQYRIAFCAANSSECDATAFRIALIAMQNNAQIIALSSANLPWTYGSNRRLDYCR